MVLEDEESEESERNGGSVLFFRYFCTYPHLTIGLVLSEESRFF